jgi:hypothetical protein
MEAFFEELSKYIRNISGGEEQNMKAEDIKKY